MSELELATSSSLHAQMDYAKALSAADLLPASYRNKPANILLAMGYGQAIGLDPVTAIQQIHVIEGKPTASAGLIGGLVRKAGHRLRVRGDDKLAIAEIIRSDDKEFVFRAEWSIERATKAGLTNKGVWKQYPANMLKARAITEVARDACPEVLAGVAYTPEELGGDDHAEKEIVDHSKNLWSPEADNPKPIEDVIEVIDHGALDPFNEKPDLIPDCEHGSRRWTTGSKKDGTPWGRGGCATTASAPDHACDPIWYIWSKTNNRWMTQAEYGALKAREAIAKE